MDFGAAVLYSYAYWKRHTTLITVADAYASPVWESINALLIVYLVGMEAFFPRAVNAYAELLLLPSGLSFLLLSVRQIAFALRHVPVPGLPGLNPLIFGVLGPLVPLPAMTFFTILEGQGFSVSRTGFHYTIWSLLGNPITLAFMGEALVSEFFLGALVMHWYSAVLNARPAADTSRKLARVSGLATLLASPVVGLAVMKTVPASQQALLAHLPWFGASMGLLVLALVALEMRWAWVSLSAGALMYMVGFLGYGLSQIPWLIRDQVTIMAAANNAPMISIVGWVLFGGIVGVVIPSALLLTVYLVKEGRRRYTGRESVDSGG